MLSNEIIKVTNGIVKVPQLIRSEEEGWIPTFELWETVIDEDTSIILSPQEFRPVTKDYSQEKPVFNRIVTLKDMYTKTIG